MLSVLLVRRAQVSLEAQHFLGVGLYNNLRDVGVHHRLEVPQFGLVRLALRMFAAALGKPFLEGWISHNGRYRLAAWS